MKILNKAEQLEIKNAIAAAEKNTSGEVRVYIENNCKDDVLERAADRFDMLGMHKTERRNGVLIYLASEDKKFAIIGDRGINVLVGEDFWNITKEMMQTEFRAGHIAAGLISGIEEVGVKLKAFFPYHSNDINELPDDIAWGEEDEKI